MGFKWDVFDTWFDNKLLNMLSSSADMTTKPLIAFWSSINVSNMRFNNLLNRSHSCIVQYYKKRTTCFSSITIFEIYDSAHTLNYR